MRGYDYFVQSPEKVRSEQADFSPEFIARIVQRVAKLVPGALCLAQAVAAQRLLARFGYETVMRVGVKSDEDKTLKAHAWLLFDDKVILGGRLSQLNEFQVMTDMKSATNS